MTNDPWATILTAVITSGLMFLGAFVVQLIKTRGEAPNSKADATEKLQRVIASMGAVYDDLVANIREVVESQLREKLEAELKNKLEKELQTKIEERYKDRIEGLETRVSELEAYELEANIGIGLLLNQLAGLNVPSVWKPRTRVQKEA